MDILAAVLRQAGVKARHMQYRVFADGTGLTFPCPKSIGFHVVTQGRAYLQCEGQDTLVLGAGDLVLMARGRPHLVSTEAGTPREVWSVMDGLRADAAIDHARPRLSIVSGAYQCWNDPVHPFFSELPDWYVLRAEDIGPFEQVHVAIGLLAGEVRTPDLGSETVVQALLDIIFMHILRKILALGAPGTASWGGAMQHSQVKAALELMHADCARDWRLEELARSVGLSRAGFAQKFKTALGITPLQYLTTIRVQEAMALLATTSDKLETIASAVGYGDAFGFSKVFKKLAGESPRDFRVRDRAEKHAAYRFS